MNFDGPFMQGGAGDMLTMPALGILVVGFIMWITGREQGANVFLVGVGLTVVAAMSDSHDAGFDFGHHWPGLLVIGLVVWVFYAMVSRARR